MAPGAGFHTLTSHLRYSCGKSINSDLLCVFAICLFAVEVVLFTYFRYQMYGVTIFLTSHELSFHCLDEGP